MNDKNSRPALQDDEFDIEQLFDKLVRINRKIFRWLFYPVKAIFMRPVLLAVSLCVAIGLAITLRYTLPPTYQSAFVIQPTYKTDLACLNLLDDLDEMFKEENYDAVSRSLGIDRKTSEKIRKIEFEAIFRNLQRKDTINSLSVDARLSDPSLTDTVQQGVLRYLCNSPHYEKLQRVRETELKSLTSKLESDIRENDSLKRVLANNAFPRNGGGGFVYGEPIDPVKVYDAGFALSQRLIQARSQQQFTSSFEIVKPAYTHSKPYFPKLSMLLPVFCGLALLICMIYNMAKAYRSNNL